VLRSKYQLVSTTCSEGALGFTTDGLTHSDSEDCDSEKDSGIFSQSLMVPRLMQRRLSIQTYNLE
jgi:hypothetical protein